MSDQLRCPQCISTDVSTEKRPNGWSRCHSCGHPWQESPILKPEVEAKEEVLISEIQKMTLEEGDDLVVKLRGDNFDGWESMASLKKMLEDKYPSNRVLIFFLPTGSDIDFSVIKKI